MPKCYSEQERAYIIARLKAEAAKCMGQYGIRRTTVDELVKRANIPKGTFYLFYASKELLLFEVILEEHERLESQLKQACASLDPGSITAGQLTQLIFEAFKAAEETPILKLLHSGEIELLARKLPPEVLADHFSHDTNMVETLFSAFAPASGPGTEAISTAFRALFLITLHKDEIGPGHYDEALTLLIHGLVAQLLP